MVYILVMENPVRFKIVHAAGGAGNHFSYVNRNYGALEK
jgi:hypothetical protein